MLPDTWGASNCIQLVTDAAASLGYGAILGKECFFLWGMARGVEWGEHYTPRALSDSSGSVLLGFVSAQETSLIRRVQRESDPQLPEDRRVDLNLVQSELENE